MFYHNANGHGCFATSEETMKLQKKEEKPWQHSFNCKPNEVIFGESSSNNNFKLALALARDMNPGDEVIITDIAMNQTIPLRTLEERGIIVKSVKIDLNTYYTGFRRLQSSCRTRQR
jgi:selenocysteine lyase/cysteine desulfurase